MIKCLKCAHVSTAVPDPEACPNCGAIYAKLEKAAMARTLGPASRAPGGGASRFQEAARERPFIETLRQESVYPAFRGVMRISLRIGVLLVIIGVLAVLVEGEGAAMALGVGLGLLAVVVLKFAHDATVMLADLSDAAVRLAARQDAADR